MKYTKHRILYKIPITTGSYFLLDIESVYKVYIKSFPHSARDGIFSQIGIITILHCYIYANMWSSDTIIFIGRCIPLAVQNTRVDIK